MASSASERTEQPTARRLRDARRKGQVALSRDLASAAGFACAAAALAATLPRIAGRLGACLALAVDRAVNPPPIDVWSVSAVVGDAIGVVLAASLPACMAALAGGACLVLLQTGGLVTGEALTPKPQRFDPIAGLKRLVGVRALVELGKTWTRIAVVAAAAALAVLTEGLRDLVASSWSGASASFEAASRACTVAAAVVAGATILLGAADVVIQRWLHTRDLRMTKDDVRRDQKEEEGDPHVKNARRQLHREMALSTMLVATRTASFVAVNPTHLAVAVRYDATTDEAPRIVARGSGDAARRIRREAMRAGVRIVHNRPLARSLYVVAVDSEIPEALYVAVAEVLALIGEVSGESANSSAPAPGPPAAGARDRAL